MQRIITILIVLSLAQPSFALEENAILDFLKIRSPHPTQLTVNYGDKRVPVLRVKKWDPIIVINGKEQRLRNERDYMTRRASSYGPERVELTKAAYGGMQQLRVETHGEPLYGSHPGIGEFKGVLKSHRSLKDAFISIVIYTPQMFLSQEHQNYYGIYVFTKELPDLPANKEVKVRFTTKMPPFFPSQRYFVHIFDRNGQEAKTNMMQNSWPYYALTERKLLGEAMVRYQDRFMNQDHAVTPIVMMSPLLPEGTLSPEKPVSATFTVTTKGHVEDITLTNVNSEDLNTAVQDAVQGWLFLPKLVHGEPVESRVEVPIQF